MKSQPCAVLFDGAAGCSIPVEVTCWCRSRGQPRRFDDSVREYDEAAGLVAVTYRLVLSGSGRTLAIVPVARLADDATYSVMVSGLTDVVGGAIIVPATSFTTQSTTSPVYNLDQLVFSFPNEQGEVVLNGPPGTLAPGSTILVVNESTGEVSTLGVNNDGSVSEVGGRLIAHISDRLIVTITDPQGRVTTFKRSDTSRRTARRRSGTAAVGSSVPAAWKSASPKTR